MGIKIDNVFNAISSNHLKLNDHINFKAINIDFDNWQIADSKKRWKIISSVPSLDTSVCLVQTKTFNEKIINEYPDVQLITISRDLPFAMNRACSSFINENHLLLSDALYREFGKQTGLAFQVYEILARAVLVLDENDRIVYLQIVNPLGNEPDYEKLYEFLDKILK